MEVIRGREEEAERIRQENRYDGEGLRFALIENGRRTDFITNGWENLTELDESGQVTKRIIRGMGIVASEDAEEHADATEDAGNIIDATAAFTRTAYHYYHGNERMDVEYITDEAGKVVNGYTYDAFGTIVTSSEKLQNRYTYNGEAFDKTTEQYYLRKRFYNPKLSRFIQEDEYRGDGLNLYAFCANNPVMYVDPSGYVSDKCNPRGKKEESDKRSPDSSTDANGSNSSLGTDIYRGMKEVDGKPAVGASARELGVRTKNDDYSKNDIPVDDKGMVYPRTGGMSVAPTPEDLPPFRRPEEFGGSGKDPVWRINTSDLGPDLEYVPDKPEHGTIQPSKPMLLEDYEKALADIQIKWEKVECH